MAESPAASKLDQLLAEMPRIAKAVNEFSSEAVQQQAFEALLAAQSGPSAATPDRAPRDKAPRKRTGAKQKRSNDGGATSDSKPKRRSGGPALVKELDLAPKGKASLKSFAEEKQPNTNHDRNVVSVYYLAQVAEVGPVTIDQVFTCYRHMGWRIPKSLDNSLSATASQKSFLLTSDQSDIKLTPTGMNHVEHDLPPAAKKK